MVSAAQDGDVLFLHFSGHGTQIPSADGDEKGERSDMSGTAYQGTA